MQIDLKGRYLCHSDMWFENVNSLEMPKKHDYIVLHAVPLLQKVNGLKSLKLAICQKQLSLISDLSNSIENIKLPATVRNEIARAKRENVVIQFYDSNTILENRKIIEDFSAMLIEMYSEKGMSVNSPRKMLEAYAEAGVLIISTAIINGIRNVFHSYVSADKNCRLLHSCSNFRMQDKELYKAIGRANKYLHYKDLEYFKKIGVHMYDWGGVSSFENPNGIDKFKMLFGGKPIEYYNYTIPISFKAKLFFFLNGIVNKVRYYL